MKVSTYVHVRSEDGAKSAVLAPGDTVPEWADVTNPAVGQADAEILPVPPAGASTVTEDGKDETAEALTGEATEGEKADEAEPAPAPRKRTSRAKDSQ